ncbi:UNVERIFIED_CONTAM: hypothetical protein HHA_268225 [Hammondia hammondi]|eukprot:XP_008882225.1 hypothetical protein HHA_268225 [Hammondia hammondi]
MGMACTFSDASSGTDEGVRTGMVENEVPTFRTLTQSTCHAPSFRSSSRTSDPSKPRNISAHHGFATGPLEKRGLLFLLSLSLLLLNKDGAPPADPSPRPSDLWRVPLKARDTSHEAFRPLPNFASSVPVKSRTCGLEAFPSATFLPSTPPSLSNGPALLNFPHSSTLCRSFLPGLLFASAGPASAPAGEGSNSAGKTKKKTNDSLLVQTPALEVAKHIVFPDPIFGKMSFQCPPEYDLVFNKCLKKVLRPPMVPLSTLTSVTSLCVQNWEQAFTYTDIIEAHKPSCPYGSYMNEDGNCISVDKVPAERTCPAGYHPYEKGCLRRDLIQAVPFCPSRAFQLFQHGSESECVKLTEEEPLFTCKEGVFDPALGLCVKHTEEEPTVSCPPGFELNETSHQCERRLFLDPVPFCEEGWDLLPDPETGLLTCVSFRTPPPVRVCPEEDYHLVGDSCVLEKLADPQPVCPQGFVYSRWDDMCRRVRAHAATPVCREGWKFIKETGKCTLEEEPTYLCPDGNTDGDLRPRLEGRKVERPQHQWLEKSERSEEEASVSVFAPGAAPKGRLWDAAMRALQETPFFDRRSKGPGGPQTGAEAPMVQDPAKAAQCATVETHPPQMGCEYGELISLLALEEARRGISTDHDASRQDVESQRVHSFPSSLSLEDRDPLSHFLNEERRFSQAPERAQGHTRKPHVTPTDASADEDLSASFASSSSFPSSPPDALSSVEELTPSSTSPSRLKMLNLRRPLSTLGRSAGAQALDDEREDREKRERKAKREENGEVPAPPEGGPLAAVEGQALDRRGEAKPSESGKKRAPPGASGDLSPRRGGRSGDGSDTGEADRRLQATGLPRTKDSSNHGQHEKAKETQEQRAPSTTRLDSHLAGQLPAADREEKHSQKDLKGSDNLAAPSRNGFAPFRATASASSGGSAKTAAVTQRASLGLHRLPRLPSPRSRRLAAFAEPPRTATSSSPHAKTRVAGEAPATSSTSSTFVAQETAAGLVCRQRVVVAPSLVPGPCSQKGGASPRGWGKAGVSDKECFEVRTKKPTLTCPSGRVADDTFVTSRCEQVEVEPVSVVCADGSAPSASFSGTGGPFARCLREELEPSVALCSEGFDLQAATSRCVSAVKEAPGWTCPTGYRLPEHELPPQSAKEIVAPHLGSRKGDSPSPIVVGPPLPRVQAGFCERLEYTDVQFVCPVGFGREKDKKAKEWVCVAHKAVPATNLCDSGFFLEGNACVMHLTMAPSLVDEDGRPFPCVTRGDGSNSCGHAADWQGSLGVDRETAKKHGKR